MQNFKMCKISDHSLLFNTILLINDQVICASDEIGTKVRWKYTTRQICSYYLWWNGNLSVVKVYATWQICNYMHAS